MSSKVSVSSKLGEISDWSEPSLLIFRGWQKSKSADWREVGCFGSSQLSLLVSQYNLHVNAHEHWFSPSRWSKISYVWQESLAQWWEQEPFWETGCLPLIPTQRDHGKKGSLTSVLTESRVNSAFLCSCPFPQAFLSVFNFRLLHFSFQIVSLSSSNLHWKCPSPPFFLFMFAIFYLLLRWLVLRYFRCRR